MSPCTVLVPHERQASDVWGQSGAEPNIAIHDGPGVVEVHVEHARIGAIVPIPAPDRDALWLSPQND